MNVIEHNPGDTTSDTETKSCGNGCEDIMNKKEKARMRQERYVRNNKEKVLESRARYYHKNKHEIYNKQKERESKITYSVVCPECGLSRSLKRKGYELAVKFNRKCNKCKRPNSSVNLIGKRFGKWTVLKRTLLAKNEIPGWLCRCDCGTQRTHHLSALTCGKSTSCGCSSKKRPFEWLFNKVLRNSRDYNRDSSLTYEQFLEFTKINRCCYCNTEIKWIPHAEKGEKTGYFLDRKDNKLGYTKDNCAVCCSDCNFIKSYRFTYEEMLKIGTIVASIHRERQNKI